MLISNTVTDYFESLASHEITSDYLRTIEALLPSDWKISRYHIWIRGDAETLRPALQGFKIHVSATTSNAIEMLNLVLPECFKRGVLFKVVADPFLLTQLNAKDADRGSSGKFITLYPPDLSLTELLSSLHRVTDHLVGPYILSDRRYRTSRVLFYRYGGFTLSQRQRADGSWEPIISSPDGESHPDLRTPFYELPPWVEEPFKEDDPKPASAEGFLLNGRYSIKVAVNFTNAGGIYQASDTWTGLQVVIKEARPYTASMVIGEHFMDAVKSLKREHHCLMALQHLTFIPRVIDFFEEWEHVYLVEEMLPGVPLTTFRAIPDFSLVPYERDAARVAIFSKGFRQIGLQLIEAFSAIHQSNILLGDISPGNVMVDIDTLQIKLLDFESALKSPASDESATFAALWATPGFISTTRLKTQIITEDDDWYGLGMLLYSIVLPVQTLFSLDPDSKERFLPLISRVMELPPNIERSIRYLWAGQPMSAKAELAQLALPTAPADLIPFSPSVMPPVDPSVSRNDIEETLAGVARYLLCIADTSRRDRIWPLDSSIYSTNSVSLGYGACGSLLALHTLRAAIPPECLHWLDQYMNREQPLPRGLLTGSSGVAWTLAHVGFGNQAVSLMTQLNTKGAAHDATLCFGLAGEVIANLYIARLQGNPVLREAAISGGDRLLQIAHVEEPGVCWENPDEYAPTVGLVYGGSGIAMALMALFRETQDARFLETAQSALKYELDGAVADGDKLRWNKGPYANVQDPYLLTGAAGISTALIAMWQLTRSELHLDLAERAANGSYSRFTVMPGQLEGLSGIGETMLDLYQATGRKEYLHRSWRIAESILCYRIPRHEGYAFPGRLLVKISADFAYGISGIVCFLSRLITGGPRAIFTTELPILERESHASK